MSSVRQESQIVAGSAGTERSELEATEGPSVPGPESRAPQEGCYVYCVCRAEESGALDATGIGGKQVSAVHEAGLSALVHDGSSEPYSSRDPEVVAAWVVAHHRVVETAWRRWGTVLPINFNTIIAGDGGSARENLRRWLREEQERLKQRLDALLGLAEYGVQVFCDPGIIAREAANASPEVQALRENAERGARGTAYLSRRRIERALRHEGQARVSQEVEAFSRRIASCVVRLRAERVQDVPGGRPMVLNQSCLVSAEQYPQMEAEIARMSGQEGYVVRLVGPLPPYSFC